MRGAEYAIFALIRRFFTDNKWTDVWITRAAKAKKQDDNPAGCFTNWGHVGSMFGNEEMKIYPFTLQEP